MSEMAVAPRPDTVLVIDDEPDSLRMLTAMLETADLTVLIATSGKAALDVLQHVKPDLILMDAVMPGIDGFETTTLIKRDPALAPIPIIFMTGLTESEHVIEAFEVGGVDYVRKPINWQELLARVRVHMAQSRAVHASVTSLDATGRLMMATDSEGRLLWCTPLAERAIARVAPGWDRGTPVLPPLLRGGVQKLLGQENASGSSIRIEQPQGTIELVVIDRLRGDEVLIQINELDPKQDVLRLQNGLNITSREAEVLLWVSYGKSNSDISDVLTISPRTVQKHLEHIYDKMGVETRSSAAAIAIKIIGR
ncbi:response regulator [Novosphingobium sp. G106]|uniref:response regulator transcription factor n=1 Tax=Novosphingobium sp. G106 TaxID=2849500 RepID=UPI001C2D71EB|nr:DNA-binding response regulator [Novosphingobium sp. G106]MBV1689273.1 response regulator [Novosphingobium sp. G106]